MMDDFMALSSGHNVGNWRKLIGRQSKQNLN